MKCAEKGIKHDMEKAKEERHGSGRSSKRSGVGAPKFNAFVSLFFHRPRSPILSYILPLISVVTDNHNSA